ncbi:serine/threonine-protein phosphatase 2B catalytic subunit [Enteropsectra breve]|nr:serine/threonine-protein phosphatase 2B catalytic subunit [Enteropsectra breve]
MKIQIKNIVSKETYTCTEDDSDSFRINSEVPAVACQEISDIAILNQKYSFLDLETVKTHFRHQGRLSNTQARKILNDAAKILKQESNVVSVNRKCHIIGDIHGQLYDLFALLENYEFPRDCVVFLGDYVDRGVFSVETFLYLLLLKTYYPENVILLRGNHESEKMTKYFTFYGEVKHKYGDLMYSDFLFVFNLLPVAAVVQNSAFCCHGGISPDLALLEDINKLNRVGEIKFKGLLCDILWSDPATDFSAASKWRFNSRRNCSYFYTYEHVCKFLKQNKLKVLIRGHEVHQEGYKIFKEYNGHPSVVTLFSAPNYCDTYGNKAGVIEYDEKIVTISQFSAVSHPYVLPGYLDGISWSIPFVAEHLADLLEALSEVAFACDESTTTDTLTVDNELFDYWQKKEAENNLGGMTMELIETEMGCLNTDAILSAGYDKILGDDDIEPDLKELKAVKEKFTKLRIAREAAEGPDDEESQIEEDALNAPESYDNFERNCKRPNISPTNSESTKAKKWHSWIKFWK